MKYRLILLLTVVSCSYSFAQSTNKKASKEKDKSEIDRGATYKIEPEKGKKKKAKYSISKNFDKKIEEYEKRMVVNAKKNKKIAKEMEKPQYSDPTYFGHKKKPKKRPQGKKKFCKECGIYH
jgi:hypothetical protein